MRNLSIVALAMLCPALAFAQQSATSSPNTTKFYAAVHLGGQAGDSSLRDEFVFTVYDETASVTSDQDYGGGFLFNVEGGYLLTPRLAAGLAITRTSGEADTRLSASIPHPQLFDRPRTATFDAADTAHREAGFHFFVSYLMAVRPNVDVRVFAGPSIFRLSHDLVTKIAFTETAPFTSVTISDAAVEERTKTLGTFHVGTGATWHLTDRIGIDGFFRYARRTVDLPGATVGVMAVRVGGAQLGLGGRLTF